MSDKNDFHILALKSSLFKGRPDLYFCYLKSEKIAHGIARLFPKDEPFGEDASPRRLRELSGTLPETVARYAARELEEEELLVEMFSLLSLVRLCVSQGYLEENNGIILLDEYQGVVEKISLARQASPYLSLEDFSVLPFPALPESRRSIGQKDIKDKQLTNTIEKDNKKTDEQKQRSTTVLNFIREKGRASIKDISRTIKDCSEKTIQRELAALVKQGLLRKEGERRWSVYLPVQG